MHEYFVSFNFCKIGQQLFERFGVFYNFTSDFYECKFIHVYTKKLQRGTNILNRMYLFLFYFVS